MLIQKVKVTLLIGFNVYFWPVTLSCRVTSNFFCINDHHNKMIIVLGARTRSLAQGSSHSAAWQLHAWVVSKTLLCPGWCNFNIFWLK